MNSSDNEILLILKARCDDMDNTIELSKYKIINLSKEVCSLKNINSKLLTENLELINRLNFIENK